MVRFFCLNLFFVSKRVDAYFFVNCKENNAKSFHAILIELYAFFTIITFF